MLFFPYKADVGLSRLPVLTIAVCALCVWVFVEQLRSAYAYRSAIDHFCNHEITREERLALRYLPGPQDQHYCDVLLEIHESKDKSAAIRQLAENSRSTPFYSKRLDELDYITGTLTNSLRRFESSVPNELTQRLHFDPNHPTLASMITAAFSHGSWWHLASNLIFFYAFAAAVEVITGYAYFLGFIILSAVGTHLAYRYSIIGADNAAPTVGLSGVVMAMMTFLATIMPALRIRVFFWFIIFVRVFLVPALAIAALYVGENIVDYAARDPESNVNYIAHISGAAIGAAMGIIYRLRNREFLRELRREL